MIAAVVLCVTSLAGAQDLALRAEGRSRVELSAEDPPLQGTALEHTGFESTRPSRSLTYECDFAGRVNVWVTGKSVDPLLVVECEWDELVLGDLDSGGGTTPFLSVDVLPGQTLVIRVAATTPESTGEVEVHAVACPEPDEMLLAAEQGTAALAEVRRLYSEGDSDRAGKLLEETARLLLERETLGAPVAELIDQLATTAGRAGAVSLERELREASVAYWQSCLPETHVRLT